MFNLGIISLPVSSIAYRRVRVDENFIAKGNCARHVLFPLDSQRYRPWWLAQDTRALRYKKCVDLNRADIPVLLHLFFILSSVFYVLLSLSLYFLNCPTTKLLFMNSRSMEVWKQSKGENNLVQMISSLLEATFFAFHSAGSTIINAQNVLIGGGDGSVNTMNVDRGW